MPDYRD
jgi:hypothetical protein